MITCVVEYTIDSAKTDEFERFGRAWIHLVNKHGGIHHGYFLPSEGASDRALALFSFPSLADYESYRAFLASIRSSSPLTRSATVAVAYFVTNGRSCAPCSTGRTLATLCRKRTHFRAVNPGFIPHKLVPELSSR